MLDHLLGVILLGLGISSNPTLPAVQGESTDVETTITPTTATHPTTKNLDGAYGRERMPREGSSSGDGVQDARVMFLDTKTKRQMEENIGKMFSEKRKQFQEQVTEKREATKEERTKRKEEFQEKISEFKDERKQEVLTTINEKLTTINTNRTDKMTEFLKKISEVLEKVTSRAATAKAEGKDTTDVDAAITAAQTALTTAQSAVTTQAGKTYVLSINSEDTAKNDVGTAMSGLQSDLKTVYAQVIAAKQALAKAVSALATIMGETKPSGAPTGGVQP